MNWDYSMIALLTLGLMVLYILIWVFIKPVTRALKLILNSLIGACLLGIFNYIGSLVGVSIGVNWWTALVCGVLGIPGFVLLLLLKWLFHI